MENSVVNKINFFALYYGQKVKRSYMPEQTGLTTVDGTCFYIGHLIINGYMELKPLSSITDEDKNKLRIIQGFLNAGIPTDIKFRFDETSFEGNIIFDNNDFEKYVVINSNGVDFLRSKGYAVPWMGLSVEKLVEYGWVKTI